MYRLCLTVRRSFGVLRRVANSPRRIICERVFIPINSSFSIRSARKSSLPHSRNWSIKPRWPSGSGADVINIHGGGAFGDKRKALDEFSRNLDKLSARAQKRLTVENDDRIFTPLDLLPLCRKQEIPFVYDVHHHRCHRDDLSEEAATDHAIATWKLARWKREPLFHISSPIEGWQGRQPQRHHDFIDVRDVPQHWLKLDVTVEVEAKAKELAVLKLAQDLKAQKVRRRKQPAN